MVECISITFMHFPVDGCLSCFKLGAIMNNAHINLIYMSFENIATEHVYISVCHILREETC